MQCISYKYKRMTAVKCVSNHVLHSLSPTVKYNLHQMEITNFKVFNSQQIKTTRSEIECIFFFLE